MPFPTPVSTPQIIELHNNGLNCEQISKKTGLSWNAVYKRLWKLGIQPNSKCRSTFDVAYFDAIDDQRKAYWLGFILADGCVLNREYAYQNVAALRVGLASKDKSHLEQFLRDIGASNAISSCSDGSARVSLNSQYMISKLSQWGCVPRKTKILSRLPKIPSPFMHHCIRGYFDGDGSVSRQGSRCRFNILGNRSFLLDIRKVLAQKGVELKPPIKTASAGLFSIGSNGNQKCKQFYEIVYSGAERFLARKKEVFDAVL